MPSRSAFARVAARILGFGAVILMLIVTTPLAFGEQECVPVGSPPPVSADRAVSLREIEHELQDCQAHSNCTDASLTWYGITRIGGYVVDPVRHDIILYGATEPGLPPLRVEDFVVALRNSLHLYIAHVGDKLVYSDPAVSIDPDPRVMHELDRIMAGANGSHDEHRRDQALEAWCSTCALPQQVRVEGVPGAHFSSVMVSADYLLKRLVDGSIKLDGLESLGDTRMSQAIKQSHEPRPLMSTQAGMNRFWFNAGGNLYTEDENAVQLLRSDVVLRDEAEVLSGGRIVSAGRVDPLAHSFACAFSRNFPALAGVNSPYPVYAELEALYRWSALAHILSRGQAFAAAGYMPQFLLNEFVVPTVEVPRVLSGIASVKPWDETWSDRRAEHKISLRLPSCGGVSMAVAENLQATPDSNGELRQLRHAVVDTRPAIDTTSWLVLQH